MKDLTTSIVRGIVDISNMMKVGGSRRTVGKTKMNDDSSRSHSIFTIYIENAVMLTVSDFIIYFSGRLRKTED